MNSNYFHYLLTFVLFCSQSIFSADQELKSSTYDSSVLYNKDNKQDGTKDCRLHLSMKSMNLSVINFQMKNNLKKIFDGPEPTETFIWEDLSNSCNVNHSIRSLFVEVGPGWFELEIKMTTISSTSRGDNLIYFTILNKTSFCLINLYPQNYAGCNVTQGINGIPYEYTAPGFDGELQALTHTFKQTFNFVERSTIALGYFGENFFWNSASFDLKCLNKTTTKPLIPSIDLRSDLSSEKKSCKKELDEKWSTDAVIVFFLLGIVVPSLAWALYHFCYKTKQRKNDTSSVVDSRFNNTHVLASSAKSMLSNGTVDSGLVDEQSAELQMLVSENGNNEQIHLDVAIPDKSQDTY